jgi:hypothetical protein
MLSSRTTSDVVVINSLFHLPSADSSGLASSRYSQNNHHDEFRETLRESRVYPSSVEAAMCYKESGESSERTKAIMRLHLLFEGLSRETFHTITTFRLYGVTSLYNNTTRGFCCSRFIWLNCQEQQMIPEVNG